MQERCIYYSMCLYTHVDEMEKQIITNDIDRYTHLNASKIYDRCG